MSAPSIVRTFAGADSRSAATTVPINLDRAPTAGNLLVTWCAWDKSVGAWTVPAGFTLIASVVGTSTSGALAYKVSDGTETTVTWTGSTGGSGQIGWLAELTPGILGAFTSPTYSDVSVTSISTGTASSDTGLALAFMTSDTGTNVDGSPTWSNGFTAMPDADYKTDAGGGTYTYNGGVWLIGGDPAMGVASKVITAEAAQTTYSCTDTGDQMWAMVAVFRTAPTSADIGSGTDASATSATLTANETGASVEAASVAVSAADTGSGSDAQAITASLSATETGAGADTSGSTDVGASETASGADASVSSATLTAADAAAGADAGTTDQSTSVSAEDTTTGTDASSIAATTSASEAATAVDAGTIAASLASSDTATATEAALIQALYQAGDTGAGVELAVVTATFTATDTATSVDAGSVVDTSAAPLAVGITARARPLTPTAEGASLQPVASAQPLTPTAEVR